MNRIELFTWSCYINAVLSALMALFVLLSRPLTKIKVYWAASCLSVLVWSIGIGWMSGTKDFSNAIIAIKITHLGAIFIPIFMCQTSFELLGRKQPKLIYTAYIFSIFLLILNFTDNLFSAKPNMGFAYFTSPKWGYPIFIAHLYGIFIAIITFLFKASTKTTNPLLKKQLQFLFVGVGLGFLGGQTTIPLIYGVNLFPWGNFFCPIYIFCVGYGMLKYQFMDFKLTLKKMGLILTIYLVLILIAVPLYIQLFKADPISPAILPNLIFFIAVSSLILSSGPLIYSYLTHKSFWLKGNLSQGITHELKSPLGAIQSASEIIMNELSKSTTDKFKVLDYLNIIANNTGRLEQYTGDLLTIAKSQEGELKLRKEKFNFSLLIHQTIQHYKEVIGTRPLKFTFSGPNDLAISGDKQKLSQVISNLLSNAVKFSEKGEIQINIEDHHIYCVVYIIDQGKGIAPHDLPRIFERFYQGKNAGKGSGLGLTIAKIWVEAHGGRIWAGPGPGGEGTMLAFSIPIITY